MPGWLRRHNLHTAINPAAILRIEPPKYSSLRDHKIKIETHSINNTRIAEVIAENIIIDSVEDGSQSLADVYYQDFDKIILYEKNIPPLFFDLKTGMVGEILQKFSNFRVRLAIVGDFDKFESKSIKDFIFESNKNRHINFVNTLNEGLERLSK